MRLSKRDWLIGALIGALYRLCRTPPTPHNEHAIQAWAWLHGHLWIDGAMIWERVLWRGHWYQLHPPLNAVAMIPSVALWGSRADQTTVSVVLGGIAAGLVQWIWRNGWLTAFWAFGTVVFYEATLGASWGFCLVLSTIPTLLVLRLALGGTVRLKSSTISLLCGLFAGLAALARYDLAMAWPIYWALLPSYRGLARRRWFIVGPALAVAAYVLYAQARFGTWTDIAIWEWWRGDAFRLGIDPAWGPFNLHYLPGNLYTAIFLGPGFQPVWPYLRPTILGQSIVLTSPAFLIAFNAAWDWETAWLWLAVAATMSGCMLVWSNGQAQFGARYWIQAYPFLLALCAKGWRGSALDRALVIMSIGFVTVGTAIIRWYQLPGFV
jgi:hypothetical protein